MTTAVRPQPGTPRAYHFPTFERVELENGLAVVVAPVRKLPVVSVMLLCDAGGGTDAAPADGLAALTNAVLAEGTSQLTGAELTERLERLGAAVTPATDWDTGVLSLTVLRSRLVEAMSLFAAVVLDPQFPEREVERLKAERLAELLQLEAEPRGLADDMFTRFLYATGSRYGLPEEGSSAGISSLDRPALVRFHRERYRPGGSTLVMVGDLSMSDGVTIARNAFGAWTGRADPSRPVDDRPARLERATHIVAKPDAPQSELRIGHVGLPRSAPDYFPVLVMNAVLGGLFSSRINLNLREAHAYTYGASSGFEWRRGAGPFLVSTAVRSDVTDAAAREVVREIERMRSEPITNDELTLATSYLVGVFPIKYETTEAIARALSALVIYGLPDDYFDSYRDHVRSVTIADVQKAAAAHLHAGELQLLAVGDPAVVRAPLGKLDFGPVTLYDTRGAVVDA